MNRLTRQPRLVLQPRDRDMIVGVFQHGFLLRDHIHNLYFPDADVRRANRRLLALSERGLLVGHPLPLGGFALGTEGFLPNPGQHAYRLGEAGVDIVSDALGLDPAAVRKRLKSSPTYTAHCVAVASLRIALAGFQKDQGYRLDAFLTEGEARHRFEWRESSATDWRSVEIRPDALATLSRLGNAIHVLLEADRGTQSKAAFLEKLALYAIYRRTSVFAARFSNAPLRLLLVTVSTTRRDTLAALVGESDLAGETGVALATFSDLLAHGPLGPIWRIPALGDERNHHVLSDL